MAHLPALNQAPWFVFYDCIAWITTVICFYQSCQSLRCVTCTGVFVASQFLSAKHAGKPKDPGFFDHPGLNFHYRIVFLLSSLMTRLPPAHMKNIIGHAVSLCILSAATFLRLPDCRGGWSWAWMFKLFQLFRKKFGAKFVQRRYHIGMVFQVKTHLLLGRGVRLLPWP
jgi:hypothetical protein